MREPYLRAASLWHSFLFAYRGVRSTFAEEQNFRVQCLYGCLVAVLLLYFKPPLTACLLSAFSVILLLSAELANSALERLVDLVSPGEHPLAGQAKDMAAGAVMLVSFGSAVTVFFVLLDYLKTEALIGVGILMMWLLVAGSVRGRRS